MKLSGLMIGAANAGKPWGQLQPGSIADNLTSLGAYFHTFEQTRISYWIANGAAASAGTVAEPYAIWTKFPNARLFFHYASGCTVLESYLQSVASPLQLLPVGDPLCRPWGGSIPLTLISMDDDKKPVSGIASFIVSSLMTQPGMSYLFLLDGRAVAGGGSRPGLQMDTQLFDDGYHELEAVAYSPGPIRSQGHAQLEFKINNRGQSANLQLADASNTPRDLYRPFDVLVSASAGATGLAVCVNERILWRGRGFTEGTDRQPLCAGNRPRPRATPSHRLFSANPTGSQQACTNRHCTAEQSAIRAEDHCAKNGGWHNAPRRHKQRFRRR
ncbi:MAG: hypothetical protein M5U15_07930 [Kiritimatiellae bacterium]|nr:hypothetical protein [Kiritimatiellia bacterium]